ncbi:MAG: hypothetical protein R3242_03035 [Akkermansiaceae bacterium]|nr:hypothetical protein [Akkermansiaceae bacterium]
MTPLPQRKKTPEEIAQLRDQLGVPQATPATTKMQTVMEPSVEAQRKATTHAPPEASEGSEDAEEPQAPEFRKLIHSDPDPIDPAGERAEADSYASPAAPIETGSKPGSPLPERRRSPHELEELRRREMLSQVGKEPPVNYKFQPAHPALITFGYLLAAAGSCSFWMQSYPRTALAAGCMGALAIAVFLFICRPASQHHAGFISAIALLVGTFTIIHQVSQQAHAS